MSERLQLLAACAFGLESVVSRELHDLGIEDAKPVGTGRVAFEGTLGDAARCNLWLRCADRVLIVLHRWRCADFDALFDTVRGLPWERWIGPDEAFPVDGRSVKSTLSSVPAVQRATKKAIVERLQQAHQRVLLPESGAVVRVEIALLNDEATITIDTSGDGLHKRGYRPLVGAAALKETLAAGLVMLSTWRPHLPLVDPFCGTGTIAIEAALWAKRLPPGIGRGFAMERWGCTPAGLVERERASARAQPRGEIAHAIHASDIDEQALAIARKAASAAGVEREIHFKVASVEALSSKRTHGCIITNPPYGVRLGEEEAVRGLYATLPSIFKRLPTWSFHILSGVLDLERIVGQQATRRRKLYNSQIECTYFSFLGPKPPRPSDGETGSDASKETPASDGEVMGHDLEPAPRPIAAPAPLPMPMPAFGGLRERDERELAQFADRLAKNVRHLRKYPSRGITCYRVYERDCPDVPLIIDRYEDHAHVAEYEREHSRTFAQHADWWQRACTIIAEALSIPTANVHAKEKHRQRGLTQHEKVSEGGTRIVAIEGGLKFEVNLTDYIDTGLFLDHRLTRAMVREQARGKRFLNLFSYTGSFTVYAAAGGCARSVSIDLSQTYLAWAERNLRLNGLWDASRHTMLRGDVLEMLEQAPRGERFDLVVCDPPTFSNSKSTQEDWQVAEQHTRLFEALRPLLAPEATVYFSTNYRRFKLDEQHLEGLGLSVREISGQTVPPEYRNDRIHRCWKMLAP